MSRNLNNLKRLCQKMQTRYGSEDVIVLQIKKALESREAIAPRHPWRFAPLSERHSGRGTGRNQGSATIG
jgi:hypothetical protein